MSISGKEEVPGEIEWIALEYNLRPFSLSTVANRNNLYRCILEDNKSFCGHLFPWLRTNCFRLTLTLSLG